MTDGTGTTTTVYDAANELISDTPVGGPTLAYSYDPAGNLVTAGGDGQSNPTGYHYGKVDEIDQMTEPNGNIDIQIAARGGSIVGVAVDDSLDRVDEALLRDLYVRRGMPLGEVGAHLGVSSTTASRLLDRYGIAKRRRGGSKVVDGRPVSHRVHPEVGEEVLRELYEGRGCR